MPTARKNARKKIRYAVVGAGHIAQVAFMPGVAHTGNSELTAIVTGDKKKADFLSRKYKIEHVFDYDEYDTLLKSGLVDAVYIALPNAMHCDYTIRALKAGIHVLLEKPMAVSEQECKKMQAAASRSKAKLMIAYRLHFEPATLEVLKHVRKGDIGNPRLFVSTFCQTVPRANHRAKNGFWAGPAADMGPYPINAARTLFGDEPTEVWAFGSHRGNLPADLEDTVNVTLLFPKDRVAQFTVSYALPAVNDYRILGDEGEIFVKPGFTYGQSLAYTITKKRGSKKVTAQNTDHFGGELYYFSECILKNRQPEPDGEEGWCDVRIVAAIERALKTGRPQKLRPYKRKRRPESSQAVKLRAIKMPDLQHMKDVIPPSK